MRNINVKFKVATNSNTYFATSIKTMASFCKKHDFVVTCWYSYLPLSDEKKAAIKCGRGVYGILDNN